MSNNSFYYFPRLPLELRRLIWNLCLPRRIAEEDIPYYFFDGDESRQACNPYRTTHQNNQLPTIAFVNSESQQVALEQGRWYETKSAVSPVSIWVQPRWDVLHLNWMQRYYSAMGDPDSDSPIFMFLWRALDLGMHPSIEAELLHAFSLKAVLDGDDNASESPCVLYHCDRVSHVRHLVAFAMLSPDAGIIQGQVRLDVAVAAVSLHITKEAALRSGLFGPLGDAPVQMVDVNDEARLREFQALFREHALEKEPAVQTLFEVFISPQFRAAVEAWKRQADWIIFADMWDWARDEEEYLDILGTNPGSAWFPYLPEKEFISMSSHLPNEEHPWVKQARQMAPQLRPRIMVQYCTNECYINELPPKGFGSHYHHYNRAAFGIEA